MERRNKMEIINFDEAMAIYLKNALKQIANTTTTDASAIREQARRFIGEANKMELENHCHSND